MRPDGYRKAVAALSALGPLRVWSLLVTVFGDLAPRDPVDGPTLTAIMDEIGIKPEATRVALHRLRADGWIESTKVGRVSEHRLSAKGRHDSDAARPRIYGPVPQDGPMRLALLPPDAPVPDATRALELAPRLFACDATTPTPRAMILHADTVPHWAQATLEPEALCTGYDALRAALDHVPERETSALRRAVLRVLIVHAWRRLCLRHPALPPNVHSDRWNGHACRARVLDLLNRLERPALDALGPN